MEFKIHHIGAGLVEVKASEGSTTIELGTMFHKERHDLAETLRQAAYQLDGNELVTKESAEEAIRHFEDDGNSDDIDDAFSMLVSVS